MQDTTQPFRQENIMIINFRDYKKVDFKKYKRVFIFGCSFTRYEWPTWAHILSLECTNAKIYNFGQTGGGNLFISERITAANQKFRFTEDDLVLMMWSTFAREDRYIKNRWETPGNIFTQGYYSAEFVKKYSCVKGYLVRDLALISMIKTCLTVYPCDAIMLKSVEPEYERNMFLEDDTYDVIELYRDVIYDMGLPLYHFFKDGNGGWINGHHYHWPGVGNSSPENPFKDYHPNPEMYMKFLLGMDFNLSEFAKNTAIQWNKEMQTIKTRDGLVQWSDNIYANLPGYNHSTHLI